MTQTPAKLSASDQASYRRFALRILGAAVNDHLKTLAARDPANLTDRRFLYREYEYAPECQKQVEMILRQARQLHQARLSIELLESFIRQAFAEPPRQTRINGQPWAVPRLTVTESKLNIEWDHYQFSPRRALSDLASQMVIWLVVFEQRAKSLTADLAARRAKLEATRRDLSRPTGTAFLYLDKYSPMLELWCALAGYDCEHFQKLVREQERRHELHHRANDVRARWRLQILKSRID